jgi:protein TonB
MTISPFCAQQETGTPAVATVPSQVLHAAGSVKPPKLIHQVDPSFSKEARKKKVSGNVEVYLIVDEQGFPQSVRVVRSVGYGLDEEAVKAVSQYRFAPATREGVPVKVDMYIDVNFQRF